MSPKELKKLFELDKKYEQAELHKQHSEGELDEHKMNGYFYFVVI